MRLLILWCWLVSGPGFAQSYTSYRTGADTSVVRLPAGGTCLMGGATEDDNAMRWFLQRAAGGDVLVLRATGADGYNDYFYNELGVAVNSVETLVLHEAAATQAAYVRRRIDEAEAIWLAGGNQATYVSEWRGTDGLDSLLNAAVNLRRAVIGGTSAGMAILGQGYFAATNGTVTSAAAIADPYGPAVTVDTTAFLRLPHLERILTETHFDNPDRRGRLLVFLARLYDAALPYRGIACDEYTAVCIDAEGRARVFGGYPTYDDFAYFVRPDCSLPDGAPEALVPGQPLVWDHGGTAVHAYRLPGTPGGIHSFELPTWTGDGGTDLHWSVGAMGFRSASAPGPPDCAPVATERPAAPAVRLVPQPATGSFRLRGHRPPGPVVLYDLGGRPVRRWAHTGGPLSVAGLPGGVYVLRAGVLRLRLLVQ